MKILHLIDSGGLYGAEMMLLQLMSEQVKMGYKPILGSIGGLNLSDKAIEVAAVERGLLVERFRMCNGPNLFGVLRILKYAQKANINLLHSHGYKGNILFGFLPRKFRKLPLVTTVHGWTGTGKINKMAVYEWLDRLSLKYVDRVVLVNPLMSQLPALKKLTRVEVVENGLDPVSDAVDELDSSVTNFIQKRATIVAVGRFSPEKAFDLLLEAVASLVKEGLDVQLLLLGDGGLRENLESQAESLGIAPRVFLPGHLPYVERYISLCTVFAMPSLTEGWPMALLEAMRSGVPIIASQVGGIPTMLDHGRAGHLVPPAQLQPLVDSINEVLCLPETAKEQTIVAHQRVVEQYTSLNMAKKYQNLYQQLCAGF